MLRSTRKNIVLIGLMGAGKSSVARYLSAKLNIDAASTDDMIEKEQGKTVTVIFKEDGESTFRKLEKEVVARIATREGVIIDCGGGVVIDPENMDKLKRTGVLFYISATPEFLYQNTQKNNQLRPLLITGDPLKKLTELLKEREAFYKKADFILETTDQTVEQIGEEIIRVMNNLKVTK